MGNGSFRNPALLMSNGSRLAFRSRRLTAALAALAALAEHQRESAHRWDKSMESSRESEAAHQRRLDECFNEMELRRKFDSRQSTFLTDFEAKMRQVDLAISSTANGLADPVAAFTQRIEEICSHHDALIGASMADFGSFANALDGCHPQMPLVDNEDDYVDAADIAFVPPSPQPIP
jgi:hypothetical protein